MTLKWTGVTVPWRTHWLTRKKSNLEKRNEEMNKNMNQPNRFWPRLFHLENKLSRPFFILNIVEIRYYSTYTWISNLPLWFCDCFVHNSSRRWVVQVCHVAVPGIFQEQASVDALLNNHDCKLGAIHEKNKQVYVRSWLIWNSIGYIIILTCTRPLIE